MMLRLQLTCPTQPSMAVYSHFAFLHREGQNLHSIQNPIQRQDSEVRHAKIVEVNCSREKHS